MISLEVGKRYITRSGAIVEVIFNDSNPAYYGGRSPFVAVIREPGPTDSLSHRSEITRYAPYGKWHSNPREHQWDIVSAVDGQKNILASNSVLG